VFAARLAGSRGMASTGLAGRTSRLLASLGLDTDGPLPDTDALLAAFRLDKKYRHKKDASGVRFVLLEDVGRPAVVDDVTDDELRGVLDAMGASV